MASAAWEGRNARARALGFRNYYDYRAHNYGRRPASEPRARGAELRRLRGHAGVSDLDRAFKSGRVELVNVVQVAGDPPELEILLTFSDGSTRSFTVKGEREIEKLAGRIDTLGPDAPRVVGSPKSVRAITQDLEDEEARAEAEALEQMTSAGDEPDEPYDPNAGIPF